MSHGLGRIFKADERDHLFALPTNRPEAAAVTTRYWLSPDPVLDQGDTSMCVVFSSDKWLTTYPIRNKGFEDREAVYKECQRVDEFPGEDYDGTTVRAAMKVLQSKGLVNTYRWAFSQQAVLDHLLIVGPVIMGTNWTEDMFKPDRYGYVHPTGRTAGGHAYCLIGASRTRSNPDGTTGAVRAVNSWGAGWGDKGRFWLSLKDLDALIKADGEACTAQEMQGV